MCGGRGTRMATDREKPLVTVGGRATVDRVLDALVAADRVDRVHAVVSPNAPATREHASNRAETTDEIRVINAPGDGYVADLTTALNRVEKPVASVAADVPLLAGSLVDRLLGRADGSTTIVVPARLKRTLGASVDERPYGVTDAGDDPQAEPTTETGTDRATDDRRGSDETDERGHTSPVWVPTGVNLVGHDADEPRPSWDARLAVNLNYRSDRAVAERLVGETSDRSREEDG